MEALATDETPLSEPLRRALDALLDGRPIPDETRTRLTDAERAHLSGLAATSALTRIVLALPVSSAAAETASLQKAHAHLAVRPSAPNPALTAPVPQRENWFRRWRRGDNKGGER